MSFQKLLAEVILQVLQQLRKCDFYSCMYICKSWNLVAVQFYYQEFVLGKKGVILLKQILSLKKKERDQKLVHSQLVRKLKIWKEQDNPCIYIYTGESDSEEEYASFYTKHILLQPKEFVTLLSYLLNIKNLDFSDSIDYRHYVSILFRHVESNKHLRCIENITTYDIVRAIKEDRDNFKASYKFRQRITHLKKDNSVRKFSKRCARPLTFLSHFPCLTYLKYRNEHDSKKHLSLCSYTPNTLDTLRIHMENAGFYSWIEQCGTELVIQFTKRLSLINEVDLEFRPRFSFTQQWRQTNEESKMTIFYKFVNAIIGGDEDFYCTACYREEEKDSSIYEDVIIAINRKMKDMTFTYVIDDRDHAFMQDNGNVTQNWYLPLPVNIQGPEMINDISFSLAQDKKTICEQVLDYAVSSCPYLERISINCLENKHGLLQI